MTDEELRLDILNATRELETLSPSEENTTRTHSLLVQRAKYSSIKALRKLALEDLEMAARHLKEALVSIPEDSRVNDIKFLAALIWKARGDVMQGSRDRIVSHLVAAVIHRRLLQQPVMSPLERIKSHRGLADWMLDINAISTAAQHLQAAMDLIPLMAKQFLSIDDLEYVLKHIYGLSSLTAAAMLKARVACPHAALATLELGRGVVHGLITSTRGEIAKALNPELRAEYLGIRGGVSAATGKMQVTSLVEILRAVKLAGFDVPGVHEGKFDMQIPGDEGIKEVPGLPGMLMVSHNPKDNGSTSANTQAISKPPGSDRNTSYSVVLNAAELSSINDDSKVSSSMRVSRSEDGNIHIDISDGDEARTLEDYRPSLATSIRAEYAAQLARVEERVRLTDTLNHFQDRLSLDYFKCLGKSGPIVSFNITRLSSHAFVITEKGVSLLDIESETLNHQIVREKANMLFGPESLLIESVQMNLMRRNKRLRQMLLWLWEAAVKPVLDSLGLLKEQPVSSPLDLPRLWWVTSGILGQFPLHAAGNKWGDSLESTMSHVVSSYVPTLRSLEHARAKAGSVSDSHKPRSLIVAMRETTGKPSLKIDEEVASLADFTCATVLECPTRSAVLRHLENSDIVHLACHGEADALHPRKSTFYVAETEDGVPGTLTVEALARVNVSNTHLAYLSACSTAELKVAELFEESLHLAGAFQMIGFPQIVGTLWETKNWAASKVATKFYRLMGDEVNKDGGRLLHHSDKLAAFLHQAIAETRAEGNGDGINKNARDNILAWAPFVHFGC
ncbi:hypothetical protein ACHAPU_006262 [Fusarium lateritium]